MKKLSLEQMEVISGGDEMDDFVGGLACGAALFGFWLAAIGCYNYFRNYN